MANARECKASMTPVFFFQAEDGIRDGHVTGVQTCALPISGSSRASRAAQIQALRGDRRGSHRRWSPDTWRATAVSPTEARRHVLGKRDGGWDRNPHGPQGVFES